MPEEIAIDEDDFSAQLKALVIEAGHRIEPVAPKRTEVRVVVPEPAVEDERKAAQSLQSLPQMLRPLVLGIEALSRAQNSHTNTLEKIDKSIASQESLPQLLAEAKQSLDQRNTVNRAMFEALHAELKDYKDGFLIENVMRPIIRDLISLYDDTLEIHRQMNATILDQDARGGVTGGGVVLLESVQQMARNLEHNVHFILEVLERMEVIHIPSSVGGGAKLDKRSQRAVAVEIAEDPDHDQNVVRVLKRGFQCKDRVIRPEEVVIQKWKEGFLVALKPTPIPNKALANPA